MYQEFFGLREDPFRVNPDPRYLFLTSSVEEALSSLAYGIRNRCGILLMTGEVGTGKTTLLQALLDNLRQMRAATAFIFNTRVSAQGLLACVMADFGIPHDTRSKDEALIRLNRWLLERYRAGQAVVLIVDEAQNLSADVLEEVRLLTNLETPKDKLLQIVLSGQPELDEKFKRRELRQLKQRIAVRCRTSPLSIEESQGYITKRLHIAGADGQPIFSPEAIESVHGFSHGIPRVINVLCEHSLIHAFADQVRPVSATHVAEVAKDFDLDSAEPVVVPGTFAPTDSPLDRDASREMLCDAWFEFLARLGTAHAGERER